jgi:hypothetical protein
MFSGGETSQVGKKDITPQQMQFLEEMALLGEEMSKSIKCEPVGQPEEGEEASDSSMVGTSCMASAEQYGMHKDTLFKDAQCNPLPGEEMYSCFIPESKAAKTATENSAKRFKELKKNEDQGWDFVKFGLENAALCVFGGVIGCGFAAYRIADRVYDYFEYEELPTDGAIVTEGEKSEGATEAGADAGVSDTEGAKAADKTKKADDKAEKKSWDGKLIIDVDGTPAVKTIGDKTDIKFQLEEQSEHYGSKETKKAIRKDMVKFARDKAKQFGHPGDRMIWKIGDFEYAYQNYAMMKREGITADQVQNKKKFFADKGWVKISYAGDQKQEWVNVFTGETKQIKKAAPAGKKADSGDKKAADGGKKNGGKVKGNGGKKKGGSKKKASHGIEGF